MQKWCPEPLTVEPGQGAFVPLSEWHDEAVDAAARGFRPEAGFTDSKCLLESLSQEERAEVIKLLEVDVVRRFEELHREAEAARDEAAARLFAEHERWQDEFAAAVRREVEDALVSETKRREHIEALVSQIEAARKGLDQARERYRRGLSGYLPVLTQLLTVQRLEREMVVQRTELLLDRIALHRALGGTWMYRFW